MSLTENEVTLCNQALAYIGSLRIDYTDTTGTSDTGMAGVPAIKCEIHLDQTRNALLRSAFWNFASDRIELVTEWATATAYTTDQHAWVSDVLYKCNTAHTSGTWTTDYVMDGDDFVMDDDDYVRDDAANAYWDIVLTRCPFEYSYKYSVPSNFLRLKSKYFRDEGIDARLEGAYILTSLTELEIEYVKEITDPDDFDPLFTEVLICDLALKLNTSLAGAGYPVLANKKDIKADRKEAMKRARGVCFDETNLSGEYKWINARYRT